MIAALAGPAAGWLALALVPFAATGAWLVRRLGKGPIKTRMRPHYVLGYLALGVALAHLTFSMRAMAGADATGIWLGTFALIGLGTQALVGSNLQSPGDYRIALRRWHLATFVAVLAFALGHLALNR